MKVVLIIVFALASLKTFPQQVEFSFLANYGTYSMGDLKSVHDEIVEFLPVPAKENGVYPSYWGYQAKVEIDIKRFQVGVFYGFSSTGSRLTYSDYSGKAIYEQTLRFPQVGLSGLYRLSRNEKLYSYLVYQMGIGFTRMQFNQLLQVGNEKLVDDELEFKASHITISPGIGLCYELTRGVFIKAELRYLMDNLGYLKLATDHDVALEDSDGNNARADWSGLRLCAGIGLRLPKSQN